ncbi:TetR family transcriptional regulator [Acrocarpospora phusangensis]|uniref:TetR family transcriptional regulator n=1 Tax=Acrocarpospora phusangensis TaxID=1070424 RepID=A0A919UM93_9ACTN|nr:TetR family transcriptional regulator [Acrocarpospora phusangensis]GIH26749.1 TetR family transcriptional regulator [Acrocarpospora phusangensis]
MTGREPQKRARIRREALLDAAVTLLENGGFPAVTHRAVAQRAGVPLAATTYYFASRDDLVAHAFTRLVEHELTETRAILDTPGPPLQDRLTALLQQDRARQLGLWELYVHAGRDPALQTIARTWTDGCDAALATALRRDGYPCAPADVRFLATLLYGLWVETTVEARSGTTHSDTLNRALRTLSDHPRETP